MRRFKKPIALLLVVLAVSAVFIFPVFAAATIGDYEVQGNPPEKHAGLNDALVTGGYGEGIPVVDNSYKVHDFAGSMSASQRDLLEVRTREMVEKYRIDVVIVTTNDTLPRDEKEYISAFYKANNFGTGPEKDGVMFIVAFDIRKFNMSTHGEEIAVFQEDVGWILDDIGDVLARDRSDSFGAASAFLAGVEKVWTKAERQSLYALAIGSVASIVVAAGTLVLLRVSHKGSLPGALEGQHYIPQDKLQFHENSDRFVNTYTRRVARPRDNSSGGGGRGGGSSTRSSGGSSFGGGSRSF